MNKLFPIVLALLFFGCDENIIANEEEPTPILDVYCDNCEEDENGNLYYPFTGFNYGQIDFYVSNIVTYPVLVGWTSPNEFCIDHLGTEICEPVINYQTYSDDEGYGHQNFYMNQNFIGQELRLIGFINSENYDEIYVTIFDGR